MPAILIQIGNKTYEADLYEGKGPNSFYTSLPQEVRMSRWGDEFYGTCSASVKEDSTLRDLYEVGEIAFWPPGNAFCIFFGPTPASSDARPRMASPGVPLGKIKGETGSLRQLGSAVKALIKKKE